MNKKKLLAGLLSLCMTLSLLPARAHAALIKLPAPASVEILTENRNPIGEWGWEFRKGEVLVTGIPRSLPDIKVKVICLDTGEVIDECSNIISDFEGGLVELDAMSFPFGDHFEDPMPSGRYAAEAYFVGDNEKYADSDVVRSIPYIFQDPGKRYEAPKNLHWVDNTPRFTVVDAPDITTVQSLVQFSVKNSAGKCSTYSTTGGISLEPDYMDECLVDFMRSILSWQGPSEFKFRVRVLTDDRTVCQNSPWSAWSESIFISDLPVDVESGLDDIIGALPMEEPPTAQQKQDALNTLHELDQEALKNAMAADREGCKVNQKIETLELTMGLTATVDKAPGSTVGVDPAQVSIVGAGLNTVDVEQPPRMTIQDAPADLMIPDAYQSTLQVDLSMEGVNTQVDGTLQIPIRITMPVPEGMDPEKLRILHFRHSNGQPELLFPYCFWQEDRWMATFMVDHFSAFALAQAGELEACWNKEQGKVQLLNHGGPQELQLVVAGYDEDGRQVGCTSVSGTADYEQPLSVDVSALDRAATLRAFMLDVQTQEPLTKAQELF